MHQRLWACSLSGGSRVKPPKDLGNDLKLQSPKNSQGMRLFLRFSGRSGVWVSGRKVLACRRVPVNISLPFFLFPAAPMNPLLSAVVAVLGVGILTARVVGHLHHGLPVRMNSEVFRDFCGRFFHCRLAAREEVKLDGPSDDRVSWLNCQASASLSSEPRPPPATMDRSFSVHELQVRCKPENLQVVLAKTSRRHRATRRSGRRTQKTIDVVVVIVNRNGSCRGSSTGGSRRQEQPGCLRGIRRIVNA